MRIYNRDILKKLHCTEEIRLQSDDPIRNVGKLKLLYAVKKYGQRYAAFVLL